MSWRKTDPTPEPEDIAQYTTKLRLLRARWLAPMNRPADDALIADGAVVIAGTKILAAGPAADLRSSFPKAKIIDLGDAVILPGLVNAHVHLELSDMCCGEPPQGGFAKWLVGMVTRSRTEPPKMLEAVTQGISAGVAQCFRFGVTTIGDISRQHDITRPLLRRSRLNVVSYGEVQAMAQRRGLLEERLAAAADETDATKRLHIGLTPHAPYTVEPTGYLRCLEIARAQHLPLATHLAESEDERPFLAEHRGSLRDLWDTAQGWDEQVPKFVRGPIRYAQSLGLLEYPTLLAHGNYVDDEELAILASGQASVVYCPRTHAYFSHPPHRWREMLAAGINVAIGTDSCASSPDLNLVDDLRLLHQIAPEVPAAQLWEMATTRAACAINLAEHVGMIEPGRAADLTVFATGSDDPLREILENHALPSGVWIGGETVSEKDAT